MGMFLEKQVRADDEQLQKVYSHFRDNLEDIRQVACERGVKIVFCTVGGNLKDCPPFASLHRRGLVEAERKKWDEIYRQGIAQEQDGNYTKAIEGYLAAVEIDDCRADLQFRLGRCYWAMGEYDKAAERYFRARELDTLRFRADARINEIVREVAAEREDEGVYFVDAVKRFEDSSSYGVPGEKLFYEHVHMNFAGTYILAKSIFERVEEILPERVKLEGVRENPVLTEAECMQRLVYTDWDRYEIADKILNDFIKKPPFTNQLYHDEQVGRMEQEIKALKDGLDSEALERAAEQYRKVIEDGRTDWHLHFKYGKLLAEDLKDYKSAAEQYRWVQYYVPYSYMGYSAMGTVLRGMKDYDAAIRQYLKAIEMKPTFAEAHYYLGLIYQNQGETEKAVRYYHKTVQLEPKGVTPYNNLGEILMQQGKIDEAVQMCRKGLRFSPNSSILHCNLGVLLEKQGRRDEAVRELRRALELDPNSVRIRRVLNTISKRRG
jgi:tetratricopeptide (TPR) repeat protein